MRIAIYGRPTPSNHIEAVKSIFAQLELLGFEYIIHDGFYASLRGFVPFKKEPGTFNKELATGSVDYLISIGGDGTLLETLPYVAKTGIPVLGINTGRLGFLAIVPQGDFSPALVALKNKKFTIQNRTLLHVNASNNDLFGKYNYALNEVCIQRKDASTMITIHTYLNDEFLNSYWADGLIIATPTGSTAYSLSCSGPILLPDDSSFIITPIAPHNLNVRPVVVPDSYTIKLKVEGRNPTNLVSLDSRTEAIDASV
ncbi:MAG TPA: NAD kinase, partial [Hanamia sp.]|nr:NAD kinase [Hanamia sp.]